MAQQKKILFVIGSLDRGGAETHLSKIVIPLKDRGFYIKIMCLKGGGELEKIIQRSGIEVLFPKTIHFRYSLTIQRIIRIIFVQIWMIMTFIRERPSIVHFFLPEAYCLGSLASIFVRIPYRIMSRRSLSQYKNRRILLGRLEEYIHLLTNIFIGNSTAVCKELQKENNIPKDKILLIHNGIETTAPSALSKMELRTTIGLPENRTIFVLVANLIPYKGHQDLIKAIKCLKDHNAEPFVLCIGRDDNILKDLKKECEALEIENSIAWLGPKKDVWTYLYAADIGLNCSHEEGFSNAILEAMAAGLPVIATRVGGNTDAVSHEVNGLLVNPKDPQDLSQAMLRLILDEKERLRMGHSAQIIARERYSMDHCIDQYASLYRSLLETNYYSIPTSLKFMGQS